ncbi:hypothetical protein BRPE64_CCDS00890 [Caballeronia insecticola]|uniref:Uncharacterized protein n=1 Tax=Caballeronia insecticola TaxID=758793 RepID=R4X394_9BURK|nr:hypothetical protein BRPE64_CCDS00890 [Caballeronia insecticola]
MDQKPGIVPSRPGGIRDLLRDTALLVAHLSASGTSAASMRCASAART